VCGTYAIRQPQGHPLKLTSHRSPTVRFCALRMRGVLGLTLHLNGYDWRFVAASGDQFSDSGTGTCHKMFLTCLVGGGSASANRPAVRPELAGSVVGDVSGAASASRRGES
jgi:hypothetical protein